MSDLSGNVHWLLDALQKTHADIALPVGTHLPTNTVEAWRQLKSVLGLSDAEIAQAVAASFELDTGSLADFQPKAGTSLPERMCREIGLLPLYRDSEKMVLGVSDPRLLPEQLDRLKFISKGAFKLVIMSPDDIDTGLTNLFSSGSQEKTTNRFDLLAGDATDAKTVKLAKAIFRAAIDKGASDIHIHPFVGGGAIRFRIDGLLERIATLPAETLSSLARLFSNRAGLDPNPMIAQDGRLKLDYGLREIDVRLSILPVFDGVRIVCRLLDQGKSFSLSQSGFATSDYQAIRRLIGRGNGIVLLTGPTGSGKTSTLYALLAELNGVDVNIMTLENPVEYVMPGISQVQVNEAQGLSFADTLRSILRQDPDIVLIGEIRDAETARIAAQAALTGHMVLSTLHTNDALSTVPRLLDLGLDASVLADALVGVVSQRLVRKLCDNCKTPVTEPLSAGEEAFYRITGEHVSHRPTGCEKCNFTGYSGRLPIIEHMDVSDDMRIALLQGVQNVEELGKANAGHLQLMSESAMRWIVSGKTTPLEVQRVTGIRFWQELSDKYQVELGIMPTYQDQVKDTGSQLKVMLLSSNEQMLIQFQLHSSYAFEPVSTNDQAAEALDVNNAYIAIIIDTQLAMEDAVAWLTELRSKLTWSGLPVLFITDNDTVAIEELLVRFQAPFVNVDEQNYPAAVEYLHTLLTTH